MSVTHEERLALTQATVDRAAQELARNGASVQRGGRMVGLATMLEQAVILDISGGVAGADVIEELGDGEAIAVIGLFPNESVRTGPALLEPTPTQLRRTLKTFASWQPWKFTAEAMAESIYGRTRDPVGNVPFQQITEFTAAAVSSMSVPLDLEYVDKVVGLNAKPSSTLAKVLMRPLVTFNLKLPVDEQVETTGHELVHYLQKQERPVQLFSSQKQADARTLRQELEAYHVGAMIKLHQLGYQSIVDVPTKQIAANSQLFVELIRTNVNAGSPDPFMVTPALWEGLHAVGVTPEQIIHGRIDFDGTLSALHRLQTDM